jgi:hypothetical protein
MIERFEAKQAAGEQGIAEELLEYLKHGLSEHILV